MRHYRTLILNQTVKSVGHLPDDQDRMFNAMAAEGWRLVTVVKRSIKEKPGCITGLFKKVSFVQIEIAIFEKDDRDFGAY